MCNSRADGGQRCYSHARKALDAALLAAQERREPFETLRALGNHKARLDHRAERALEERILRTRRELASTPKGRAEFQAQADQARANRDYQTFAELTELIDQGKAIEERNNALADIARTEKAHDPPPSTVDHDSLRLTPAQIREALDTPLTSEQVTRACIDLKPTLEAIHESVSDSTRTTVPELSISEQLQRRAPFEYAERLWKHASRSRYVDYQVAWRQFIDGMRQARDNPFDDVAFPDRWQRDCNYILRVTGEIAHQHRQWDLDNPDI